MTPATSAPHSGRWIDADTYEFIERDGCASWRSPTPLLLERYLSACCTLRSYHSFKAVVPRSVTCLACLCCLAFINLEVLR